MFKCLEVGPTFSDALDFFGWVPRDPQLIRAVARSQMVAPETCDARRQKHSLYGGAHDRNGPPVRIKGNVPFFFPHAREVEKE